MADAKEMRLKCCGEGSAVGESPASTRLVSRCHFQATSAALGSGREGYCLESRRGERRMVIR